MSSGLRFRKVDLHVHTPASKDFLQPCTPEEMIDSAIRKGIEVIAVTDHNTGEWVDKMKEAAISRPITVIPGVEITTGDARVHIIGLFSTTTTSNDIRDLLISLGLSSTDFGKLETFCHKSVTEVIGVITDPRFSGLAILAHADSSNGAIDAMDGQQRIKVIQHPKLNAIEIVDEKTRKFLNGTDPNYKRKIAVLQGSDNPALGDNGTPAGHSASGIGARFTYLKLDDPVSTESIRLCFEDPDVRIRLASEFKPSAFPKVKRIRVKGGGFLDGTDIEFHEGLNTIIGGKGSGKSLLVELMRFALDQQSDQKEILQDHIDKLEGRLLTYGEVEVTICDETGKEYVINRVFSPQDGDPYRPAVNYRVPQLFPVLFLSQNEIIKIAESEEEQIKFIDKFFDFRSIQAKLIDLESELHVLDEDFADSIRAKHETDRINAIIATLKEEIQKLDKQLKNDVLKLFRVHERKEATLKRQASFPELLLEQLNEFKKEIDTIALPEFDGELKEDGTVKRVSDVLINLKNDILNQIDKAKENVDDACKKLDKEYSSWRPIYEKEKQKYEETVKKLGGDFRALEKARLKKNQDLEAQTKRLQQFKIKADRLSSIAEKRKEILSQLQGVYREYHAERKAKCQKFQEESGGRLQITIQESQDARLFKAKLTEIKKGSYLSGREIDCICSTVSPVDFIHCILRYHLSKKGEHLKEICDKSGVDEERIRKLADFLLSELKYEELLQLQYKALPQDRPTIKFEIARGRYEPLNRISIGQKCTAMIIMALCEGNMPVIIDQPEDSLDLRTIWQDMCQKLRAGKEKRQFMFTTHNSSLAVASDTDKFIILEADSEKGKVVRMGAIDHLNVKSEVVTYLEGGAETYRHKARKYNISFN